MNFTGSHKYFSGMIYVDKEPTQAQAITYIPTCLIQMFARRHCITLLLVPRSGAETKIRLNLTKISASNHSKL